MLLKLKSQKFLTMLHKLQGVQNDSIAPQKSPLGGNCPHAPPPNAAYD